MDAVAPAKQIEFLSNFQRLLAEGSFVSTYKYALLLAVADLCVELGRDDDSPLDLPTRLIGEKFTEYYWRQSVPYLPMGGTDAGVLRQNTGEPPKIIRLLRSEVGRRQSRTMPASSSSWSTVPPAKCCSVRSRL